MKKYKLDKEELQVLKDYDEGKYVTIDNVKEEMARIRAISQAQLKTKNINIRLAEMDILALKEKALQNNLPYQTLVSTLIRQYLCGKFKIIL